MRTLLAVALLTMYLTTSCHSPNDATPIIFDTDMGPDYDDVGAITLLHAFADSGDVRILATMASTNYEGVAGVLSVFNTYFNRADLPIGVPKGKALSLKDFQHWTDTLLARYPHEYTKNESAPDAVSLYRKLLASEKDQTVTIVTVGFLTNLHNLLRTGPDEFSSLNGMELVRRKVKQLVCMAGRFPAGSEFNVNRDPEASQDVFTNWPTPVLLSGFEIGWEVRTGLPLVANGLIQNSPVRDVFRICIPMAAEDSLGRMSWDETAVLVAVKGTSPWYGIEKGKMVVATDGSNSWTKNTEHHHRLVEVADPAEVAQVINGLIMHQPMK